MPAGRVLHIGGVDLEGNLHRLDQAKADTDDGRQNPGKALDRPLA
jgi:hypothetical protein